MDKGNTYSAIKSVLKLIDSGKVLTGDEVFEGIKENGFYNFLSSLDDNFIKEEHLKLDPSIDEIDIVGYEEELGYLDWYDNGLNGLALLLWEINSSIH